MKSKAKIVLYLIVPLLAGYLLGSTVGDLSNGRNKRKGNDSQLSGAKSLSSAAISYQEKIMSSEEEFYKASASLYLLSSRINDFKDLVNSAIGASMDRVGLEDAIKELTAVRPLTERAKRASDRAMQSFESISKGSRNTYAVNYEIAAKDISIAYLMIDHQSTVGKHFVQAVDDYLQDKDKDSEMELAAIRDLWADFCASGAIINDDAEEIVFWKNRGKLLPDSVINKTLTPTDLGHIQSIIDNLSPTSTQNAWLQ